MAFVTQHPQAAQIHHDHDHDIDELVRFMESARLAPTPRILGYLVVKTCNTHDFTIAHNNHIADIVLADCMVHHTPAPLILGFCRARIAEHEMECHLFDERQKRKDLQVRLLVLQLARARSELSMYMSAVPPGFKAADVVCREEIPCVKTSTANTGNFKLSHLGKLVRNLTAFFYPPVDRLTWASSQTLLVLAKETVDHTSLALQYNYIQARWDEHRFESMVRKAHSSDVHQQVWLVKFKLARLRAEFKLYNCLSGKHINPSAELSLDVVREESEEE
ncbi:hypothetical protein HWV62_13709 [Athelia sp. TMB]|nr:hypothetical protein HWV62_13709 [Athelia sp. TMB]